MPATGCAAIAADGAIARELRQRFVPLTFIQSGPESEAKARSPLTWTAKRFYARLVMAGLFPYAHRASSLNLG